MFGVATRRIADVEPILYKTPKTGEKFALGEALKQSGSVVSAAGATERPDYLCAGEVNARGMLPVIPVLPTTVFRTKSTVTVPKSLLGSAVTLSADALGVTATTTGGVFTVEETDGAATNSTVLGYFK